MAIVGPVGADTHALNTLLATTTNTATRVNLVIYKSCNSRKYVINTVGDRLERYLLAV